MQARTRPVTVVSLFLFVSCLIGIVGAILVWSNNCCVGSIERWTVGFLVLCIGVNMLVQFAGIASALVVSCAVLLSCVDIVFEYARRQYGSHTDIMIGYVLLILGTMGSFASLPYTIKIPKRGSTLHFLVCVIVVALVLGNVFLLMDGASVIHPGCLALLYLLGCCWDCPVSVDFSYMAAAFLLYNDWISLVTSSGASLVGWLMVCVGLLMLICIHLRFIILVVPEPVETQPILE